jgi:hypothetical protein
MMRVRIKSNSGTDIMVLGLFFADLQCLRAGEAIEFDGTPYGYEGAIILFAAKDEETLRSLLAQNAEEISASASRYTRPN